MFNADLIDDLAREKVVVFLGAGVSKSATTISGGKIADWEEFLSKTACHLEDGEKLQVENLIKAKDYLLACEILQISLADSWEDYIIEEYSQKATPSELHRAIIKLGQRLITTTNFDKLLESAWETMDEEATHYPKVIATVGDDVFRPLKDHSGKYLIKIHGTVDRPNDLVFLGLNIFV